MEEDIWTKRPELVRRKAMGRSLVYLERYYVGQQDRYYIEANGPDYRVWKRTRGDEARAREVFQRYRFWVWFIEALDCHLATRFLTWIMHKTI